MSPKWTKLLMRDHETTEKVTAPIQPGAGYLRAEVVCRKESGKETRAATSPCYYTR